uniref:Uncharacterized protein n=1 Tax=Mandrillus leucophaeus TaxID=9568 RepID=A0A2K5Z569_MANLE
IVETHIRETEPLDGAFVVAADHLSLEALAGVDGEVCGGRLPLHLGHGALLLLGGLGFLLLGRARGDVVVVAVAGRVLAVLVVALPPRTLCCWAFPPARPPRPWPSPCYCCAWDGSTWLSTCRVRLSTSSTLWLTIWIFWSPGS